MQDSTDCLLRVLKSVDEDIREDVFDGVFYKYLAVAEEDRSGDIGLTRAEVQDIMGEVAEIYDIEC